VTLEVWVPGADCEALRARLRELLEDDAHIAAERSGDAEVLVRGVVAPDDLAGLPRLRAVIVPWAGVPERTRATLAAFSGVTLHNLHHNAAVTAEHALALLLAAARSLVPGDRALRAGDWGPRHADPTDPLLDGAVAVVLGHGAIGRRVARVMRALGMEVHAIRRSGAAAGSVGVHGPEALPGLLPRARALVVAVPHTPETDGMLGARELGLLPDGSIVVNVARGRVIDEAALYAACAAGRLRAGLDVWWRYPESEEARAATPPSAFPFGGLDNVVLSPHRAGHAEVTERLRAEHLARSLRHAVRGDAIPWRVDPARGY